ncbi:MAG: (2Fe-2S)-binding protein [Bdellovibrionales bacterium]|nr:(2Fe-2S)-binding protein [Bdellovibrionales bacterium]
MKNKSNDPKDEIVCLCNEISRGEIEAAIKQGCDTLNKIFDKTTAGVGPCGGSCRKFLGPMLDTYLETGEFPKGTVRPVKQKKNRAR